MAAAGGECNSKNPREPVHKPVVWGTECWPRTAGGEKSQSPKGSRLCQNHDPKGRRRSRMKSPSGHPSGSEVVGKAKGSVVGMTRTCGRQNIGRAHRSKFERSSPNL